jgi:hypothetical protein
MKDPVAAPPPNLPKGSLENRWTGGETMTIYHLFGVLVLLLVPSFIRRAWTAGIWLHRVSSAVYCIIAFLCSALLLEILPGEWVFAAVALGMVAVISNILGNVVEIRRNRRARRTEAPG